MSINNWEIAFRLLVSFILGGIIGLEREKYQRPAGFRTHILVCLGSTLVMLVSIYGFKGMDFDRDPARMSAQVVSGIGFLGAGTILKEGNNVRGLTTAASLWLVSGIGLAVGVGFYFPATLTTLLAIFTLLILYKVEQRWIVKKQSILLSVEICNRPGQLGAIATILGSQGININDLRFIPGEDETSVTIELFVIVPSNVKKFLVLEDITKLDGVIKASFSKGED